MTLDSAHNSHFCNSQDQEIYEQKAEFKKFHERLQSYMYIILDSNSSKETIKQIQYEIKQIKFTPEYLGKFTKSEIESIIETTYELFLNCIRNCSACIHFRKDVYYFFAKSIILNGFIKFINISEYHEFIKNYEPLLEYTVYFGVEEIAKLLIENGVDVNQGNFSNSTALHSAVYISNKSLVILLLNNGAKVDIKNHSGQTPLDLAKIQAERIPNDANVEILKLLNNAHDKNYSSWFKKLWTKLCSLVKTAINAIKNLFSSIFDISKKDAEKPNQNIPNDQNHDNTISQNPSTNLNLPSSRTLVDLSTTSKNIQADLNR